MENSILWFRQDLRLHDNESLIEAVRNSDHLIPVYVFQIDPSRVGEARVRFLIESVTDLRSQLRDRGSDLIVRIGNPADILYDLAIETQSKWLYCNRERTRDEVNEQDLLEQKLWTIGRELRYSRGKMLYHTADLPFPITHCPDAYVNFRKEVEHAVPVRHPLGIPETMPTVKMEIDPGTIPSPEDFIPSVNPNYIHCFPGGETEGLRMLKDPAGFQPCSNMMKTGFVPGPWLSMGCLSPKMVYASIDNEGEEGVALRQNLIYRDYLRMMGKKHGNSIFRKEGTKGVPVSFATNKKGFDRWKKGQTGIEIIDAAMHQLNATGWIPDVLRKVLANYLIKVLEVDWRLGAAYFESVLIDFDPCSNWVSWMNLAGVGPDKKEDRTVHYDHLSKKLDHDGSYRAAWLTPNTKLPG